MTVRALLTLLSIMAVLFTLGQPSMAYACPPPAIFCDHFKTPAVCRPLSFCRGLASTKEEQGYSLEIKGMSKDQLEEILERLGFDKSVINMLK